MDQIVTGAADWRSEMEKRKSMLRKALINLLKMWIPDHPEAGMQKIEFYRNWRDATAGGFTDRITLVSMLSSGVEDLMVHNYGERPLSVQGLLVQREGTDAFLDARNALRVVRRKFGMMTLIARSAGLFEQRNLHALSLQSDLSEADHLNFAKLMASRVEGTSNEEEQRFKMAVRRAQIKGVDLLVHNDVIGRRLPVAWPVKEYYSYLARRLKSGQPHTEAAEMLADEYMPRFKPRALSHIAQYAEAFAEDLEAPGGYDPADLLLTRADESPLLAVTRRMYDDFNLLRRQRDHERVMSEDSSQVEAAEVDAEMDFLGQDAVEGDQELLRLATALERIRRVRGRAFFGRMSMIGEQVDFFEVAETQGLEDVENRIETMDPREGLAHARAIREPFYRARALESAARRLAAAHQEDEARAAALEALEAARQAHGEDRAVAYASALGALLVAQCLDEAGEAIGESIHYAHSHESNEERAAALMRVASTLMQAGALPPELRSRYSTAVLGSDVHFWGKPEVTPALVEACLSLLSPEDSDTFIFLQKVVAHPEEEVRRSVIRAMPFGEEPTLRNMLLSHLKDPAPEVRVDVIERIGFSGDRGLFIYLLNHLRHGDFSGPEELRALALCMCRLDIPRALPSLNAMLGKLHTPDPRLTRVQAPFKAEESMQLAALEALYYLNSRDARRLIFKAKEKVRKGLVADVLEQMWTVLRGRAYGEPELPRSPHHPEWDEEDEIDLLTRLERDRPEAEPEAEPALEEGAEEAEAPEDGDAPKRGGLFGRLKRMLRKDAAEESAGADGEDAEPEAEAEAEADTAAETPGAAPAPKPRPRAALKFEGVLLEGPEVWTGMLGMSFALYNSEDGDQPMWTEAIDGVRVRNGTFEVTLGLDHPLPDMPNVVWLGLSPEGAGEMRPRTRIAQTKTVVLG